MRIGRYEVELLLGEGGVGRVYLARDPVVGRQVAIKTLRDDLGLAADERPALEERVAEQARTAATLSHPAMVSLFDMGHDERAGLFLVEELVRGPTLRERLHEGPLPAAEVAHMARTLGAVLTHAHAAGLVHRGVRPENVMLAPTGLKLADFGVSQLEPRAPAYCAPEVVAASGPWPVATDAGAPAPATPDGGSSPPARTSRRAPAAAPTRGHTPQSDQFSLAATLYEALTGRRAFPGDDSRAVSTKVALAKVDAPRKVQPALRGFLRLDQVFAQALAKDPKRRFPSCEAFGAALAAELEGPRVTFLATPGPARSSLARATRRWQNILAAVAVVVIVTLVLAGRLRATRSRGGAGGRSAPMQRVVEQPLQPGAGPSTPPSDSATPGRGSVP
ncbi:MAG TPA: serine/threonine-protein kinase [Polyangiaceae bacterium]|nr:serine/threonine-protein kinase [Polyangiaceae bacterium]